MYIVMKSGKAFAGLPQGNDAPESDGLMWNEFPSPQPISIVIYPSVESFEADKAMLLEMGLTLTGELVKLG